MTLNPMSAKREERLRAAGRLAYGSTFAAATPRPNGVKLALPERPTTRHPSPKGPDFLTVERVLRRDEGCCVGCAVCVLGGERGLHWSLHHRRGRDRKADSNSPQNLITVCGASNVDGCHGRIHQSRLWARPLGYWVSRTTGADPLLAPVFVAMLDRFVWLTAGGRYSDNPPEEAA